MPTAGGVRRVATDNLSTGGNPMATLTVWKFLSADQEAKLREAFEDAPV
jgi:hypothetical protein